MAKYSDIKGFTVQTLSTDTVASQAAGGSWATGGSLNSTGHASAGGSGSYNAALAIGGEGPPSFSPRYIALTEQYDGSSWTEVADLNANRAFMGAAGTTTASIASGGNNPGVYPNSALNESWNGSAWTEVNDLNVGNKQFGQAGTATAAFEVGGNNASTSYVSTHEQWDGTNWTESGDINTGRAWGTSFGTTTAAMYAGGRTSSSTPPGVANVESWNGSAWTEINDLNQARYSASSSGIQTNGMVFSGYQPPNNLSKTEVFDGTSFTEVGDLGTAVRDAQGANNPSQGIANALSFGGFSTAYSSVTETWTAPSDFNQIIEGQLFFNSTTNTFKETILDVPAGAWSSGGNLNEGRPVGAGYGSSNLAAGLAGGENSTDNEAYNGTSWTEVNNLNTARSNVNGTGSFTAGLVVGGYPPNTANVESWNGTNFTEVADLNTARGYQSGAGTANTANIAIGGFSSPPTQRLTVCEQYDGSSWTEVGDLTRSAAMNSTGSTSGSPYTSALCIGGYNAPNSPNTFSDLVESWDGSSWTNSTAMSNRRTLPVGNGGSVNDVVVAGGGGSAARTEIWNGSSWTELGDPSISNKFRQSGGTASTTAGIMSGAPDGTPDASTEEWNALLANKTITAS